MSLTSKQATKPEPTVWFSVRHVGSYWLTSRALERCSLGFFACVFLPVIDLFLELLGFFLTGERKTGKAILQFKRMKESSVLIIVEWVIDLLVPDYPTIGSLYHSSESPIYKTVGISLPYRYIDQFYPVCIAYEVIRQNRCPLQPGIHPLLLIRMCHVEPAYGPSMYLVGCLRDSSLDSLFICVRNEGRHSENEAPS